MSESINQKPHTQESTEQKLRPIVFIKGHYDYNRPNFFQQNLLLRSLAKTSDPDELKRMVGIRTKAELFRTLDKLALRKEYHQALQHNGIDLDSIIGNMKKISEDADSSTKGLSLKLNVEKTFLRSLGLDEYKEAPMEATRTWEDIVRKQIESAEGKENNQKYNNKNEYEYYEVEAPEVPENMQKKIDMETEMGKDLYE